MNKGINDVYLIIMKNIIILIAGCLLTGCFLRPHVVDIQQGNILDSKQAQQLLVGMSKQEVKTVMGEPVLTSAFDDNIWTYAYTNQISGGKIEKKHITLYFHNNRIQRIERTPNVMSNEQDR